MNTKLFAAFLYIACTGMQARAFQGQTVEATSAEWTFEEGSKVSAKMDIDTQRFTSIILKIKEKSISIPDSEFKDLIFPNVCEIIHESMSKAENRIATRHISFKYNFNIYPWGAAFSEVTFYFSDSAYLSREIKVPTGKDTWKYISKEKGKPEVQSGTGGQVEGIK